MKQLFRTGFNRRFVLIPVLACAALVTCAFLITEARRSVGRDLVSSVNEQQQVLVNLTDLINAAYRAESAQRGYLLTGFEDYLEPYAESTRLARERIAAVTDHFDKSGPAAADELRLIQQRLVGKLAEMDTTVEMRRTGRLPNALAIINSDVGLSYMREIQAAFDRLRAAQQQQVEEAITEWHEALRVNTLINIVMTTFTLLVLLLAGVLASREIGRREFISTELTRQVRERTLELHELSEQLMRVSEREKASLSRELHDELGSLLAAMKMDLANLKRKLKPDGDLLVPWKRLEASIDAGIDVKRRVIENLRPTLLDNLGLVAALRWQAEEACSPAGITLEIDAPEEEVPLSPDAGIAIFRAVQETFTNMLKHSRATRARMEIRNGPNGLTVKINDNGVGIAADALTRSGAHGLRQMRFRMTAIGGEVSTLKSPGGGTETSIRYRPAPAGRS